MSVRWADMPPRWAYAHCSPDESLVNLEKVKMRNMRCKLGGGVWAVAVWLILVSSTVAETKIGFRQLGVTKPVVVQRGTTTTVRVHSNYTLDEAYRVFFDRPGIAMKFLETKPISAPRKGRGRLGTPFRFECAVPSDQLPGNYEMRVATRQAASSVSHLRVTDYPVVVEAKKQNGSIQDAQAVDFPVAIAGECERTEDVDYYRVRGKAGQQVTFEVFAQRVTQAVHSMQSGNGTYLMDAILTLYAPNGQVIAQNDNFIGGDPFIAYTLPQDGDYVIEVRDARYIGNDKYVYCLEISDRPHVHAVFPMAVQRGREAKLELVGDALGDLTTTTLTADATQELGWHDRQANTPAGLTNPFSVHVSEHSQVVVGDKHGSRDTALPVSLPVGVNGRFTQAQQTHFVSFEAKKGESFLLDVHAQRVGLPLDAVIQIYDAKGKRLAEADDGLQTKDPTHSFRAPADGRYFVSVRDLHDRGGKRFLYHLRIEPAGPDFEVHGEYYYAQIAPGTRMMWFARVTRLNGFTGPVRMCIEGLPPGVTLTPVTIPAGVTHCALILNAATDAKVDASLVKVCGKADIAVDGKTQEITRYGRVVCELQSQGGGQARWPINTQLVCVTEPLDLLGVTAKPDRLTLKPGGKTEFTVQIERNKGFKESVTLEMAFSYFRTKFGQQLPPGVSVEGSGQVRLAGKKLEGKFVLAASDKAVPVKDFPIAAIARVPITFSITTNYSSNPILLTVEE